MTDDPAFNRLKPPRRGTNNVAELTGDRPLSDVSQDRLGFGPIAANLAASLLAQTTRQGLVVGIEGPWGSGKSSILNLVADHLKKKNPDVQIVRFDPWIVGQRDALVSELIENLAAAVQARVKETKGKLATAGSKAADVAKKLRGYSSGLARRLAPVANFAGVVGVPLAGVAGEVLAKGAELLDSTESKKPLVALKSDAETALAELSEPIIVLVDDLDRLEPNEAAEMMRVIRAVADFPNVLYLLGYDRDVLAGSLEASLNVKDGKAFLQKIVQVAFRVPEPEAFDLRRWLFEGAGQLFDAESTTAPDNLQRLQRVCDIQGGLLSTPRDVVHVLNSLRLHWPPIQQSADFADMVWLQIVRMKSPKLYHWVEKYMIEVGALYAGARVTDREQTWFEKAFEKLVDTKDFDTPLSIFSIAEILPGIQATGLDTEKKRHLFRDLIPEKLAPFEERRGLGSPSHYRFYFAFAKPTATLDDAQIASFLTSLDIQASAESFLIKLAKTKRPQGGTMAEVLLQRLATLATDKLTPKKIETFLFALADVMDEVGNQGERSDFGRYPSWDPAMRLFSRLLRGVPVDRRERTLKRIFRQGRALGWLMHLIRSETYDHGVFGSRRVDSSLWIMSEAEFDTAVALFTARLRQQEKKDIIHVPFLMSFLYGWAQSGDDQGARDWVAEQTRTDQALLNFLDKCRSWRSSNDVVSFPLKRSDVGYFTDMAALESRLAALAAKKGKHGVAARRLRTQLVND